MSDPRERVKTRVWGYERPGGGYLWHYNIAIDGRTVAWDNAISWQKIYLTALGKTVLFLHLMGDVTVLRNSYAEVGAGRLI